DDEWVMASSVEQTAHPRPSPGSVRRASSLVSRDAKIYPRQGPCQIGEDRVVLSRDGTPRQGGDDRVCVIDAAPPGAAADGLQGGPEAGVVGQLGIGGQVGVRRAFGEDARALVGPELDAVAADEVDGSLQADAVDDDADEVAVADAADRA